MKIVSNWLAPQVLTTVRAGTVVRIPGVNHDLFLVTTGLKPGDGNHGGEIGVVDLEGGRLSWLPPDQEVVVEPYAQVAINPDTPKEGETA